MHERNKTMTDEQKLQMEQLVEQLNLASEAYYSGKGEIMTDFEWDALFDKLKQLESETGVTLPDSPTQNVSDGAITGQKEEHEYAALSLAKTKQAADLVKWAEGKPIWISWKLDGLTLVVTYDNGRLTKVVTRGNGHIGTNITHLATAINGIPQRIKTEGHVVIRGEAVISYDDFERFLMETDEDYANPRNLASGSLTLKDVNEVRQRHLQWIPFTLVHSDENIPSWGDRMEWLSSMGFNTVEREFIEHPTIEAVEASIERFTLRVTGQTSLGQNPELSALKSQLKKNPFPVDGLVITYDDTEFAATGSVTGHHATRAGLAFKWQDETADTELEHIEWSCAASTISPVAVFRPVELEGTTVKRASLCNISECERLGIGGTGTAISVIKANKIIPKVVKVLRKEGILEIPEICPVCGSPTEIKVSENSATRTLHCTNASCPAKQLKKFTRFVSKEGMNIDGISEQTLARFINMGWISEYADIYKLRNHIHEISSLEGFGEKSASNMIRSIEKSRDVEAQRLLYALTIPMCGIDVCKRLLSAYPLEELIGLVTSSKQQIQSDDAQGATLESDDNQNTQLSKLSSQLESIPGIGPEKSASFVGWFSDDDNKGIVERLLKEVRVSQTQSQKTGARCEGLTFVITGDVHHFKNRNELKSYIESQGGRVAGSVSGSTSYLINNDVNSTSGKNKKAKELGIGIISEDEFISQFGNTAPQPSEGSLF